MTIEKILPIKVQTIYRNEKKQIIALTIWSNCNGRVVDFVYCGGCLTILGREEEVCQCVYLDPEYRDLVVFEAKWDWDVDNVCAR